MPPDGRCLYYTGVAAMHPSRYLAAGRDLDRYGYGLATDEEEAKWEDDQANLVKAKVSSLLLRDGKFAEATRLMRPGSDGYPGCRGAALSCRGHWGQHHRRPASCFPERYATGELR